MKMNSSKEAILKKIRRALRDHPQNASPEHEVSENASSEQHVSDDAFTEQDVPEDAPPSQNIQDNDSPEELQVPRIYRHKGDLSHAETVALFADRAGEYKATVQRVNYENLLEVIKDSCIREEAQDLVIPEGFPAEWVLDGINAMHDRSESPLSHHQLDEADGVITTCELAVAQTGTILLNAGPGQGRRVLTLLPDYHLCIVRQSQIVELIPEGFAGVEEGVRSEGHPITMISGPSATSDIELSRVEGVHGPRRLEILIVESPS